MTAGRGPGRRPSRERAITALIGQRLAYVRLDETIVLGFAGGRRIYVETLAHVDGPGGRVTVEPGEEHSDALAALLGDAVRAAHTRDTGELVVTFASGSELLVEVAADAESWAVTEPDGSLVICLARGELAVWYAAERSAPAPPACAGSPGPRY